jgi:peptidoglycan hydrolase CwlO-like protein
MKEEDFNNVKEEVRTASGKVQTIEKDIKSLRLLLPNWKKKFEHIEGEIDDLNTDSKDI